jgi:hypothetical protein
MKRGLFFLVSFFLFFPTFLFGQQFYHYGARAMGMGGAFVSAADDLTAFYWNPAGLLFVPGKGGMFITLGRELNSRGRMMELLASADPLLAGYPDSLSPDLADILADMSSPYSSLSGAGDWSFTAGGRGSFFSVVNGSAALIYPEVDTSRMNEDPTAGDYIGSNETSIRYRAFKTREYVFSFSLPLLTDLFFGVNVKYIKGKTHLFEERFLGEYEGGFSTKEFYHYAFTGRVEEEGSFSFDLGFVANLAPRVRVGVVGKDVSSPSFKTAFSDKFILQPRWRAGVAVFVSDTLTLAFDYDITKNRWGDEGPEMRELSFGVEKWFIDKKIAVRGGGSYNFASDDPLLSRFLIAGGFGVRGRGTVLDFSLSYQKGLEALGMSLSFGWQF